MAIIPETPEWTESIVRVEETDKVLGGENGVVNEQAKQLANRTQSLKQQVEAAAQLAAQADGKADDALGQIAVIETAAGSASASASSALQSKQAAEAAAAQAAASKSAAAADAAQSGTNANYAAQYAATAQLKAQEASASATAATSAASSVAATSNAFTATANAKTAAFVAIADEATTDVTVARDAAEQAASSAQANATSAAVSAASANDSKNSALGSASIAVGAQAAAEAARDATVTSAAPTIYHDTLTGLAATSDGQYFSVPSADAAEQLILYRNEAGVASEKKRYPSTAGIYGAIAPIRLKNRYPDSGFMSATPPPLRSGTATLQAITDPGLAALGIAKGVSSTSTSTYVLVDIDPSWIGKYVIMSCYVHYTDGATPTVGSPSRYITTGSTLDATGLSWRTDTISANTKRLFAYGRIPPGVTKLAIGCGTGVGSVQRMIAGVAYGISDAPVQPDAFQYDVMSPVQTAVEARATSLEGRASVLEAQSTALDYRATAIEAIIEPLPVNYVKNYLGNGNMAAAPAWSYTGVSPISSVDAVAELADLGISRAYDIPTAGGTESQVRIESALLASLGISGGDHLLLGSFVYASDGVSFPASFSSYSITVDGVTYPMDSTGFVQVSTNVRFLWGKKLVPSGALTRIIVGFTTSGYPAKAATRYHSGFFIHRAPSAADTPSPAGIGRYTGWDGQDSSATLFQTLQQVAEDYSDGVLGNANAPRVVLSGEGSLESYIEVRRQGKTIRRTFRPFPVPSKTVRSVFNFTRDLVDGLAIKAMSDDVAPYRAFDTTIGANHGYFMFLVAAAGHGKSQADIGSVYANGGTEWVIIDVVDAGSLCIARRTSNSSTVAPAGAYTHVYGGVNAGTITITAAGTLQQLYPPFVNRTIRCLVDGVEVNEKVAALTYQREVAFVESYDIIERQDVIAWYEANGASGGVQPTGTPAISVSISYVFDHDGHCTIYTDFLARKDGIPLSDIMFLQAQRMTTIVDGPVEYYIPKALPVTHHGVTYDYANIDSSDTSAWTTRLDFTPARCEPDGILCDRVVQLTDRYGFAMGYLPVQSTGLAERRLQATAKALQISDSSGKIYLSAIDKGNFTLSAGAYFSTIGYRNILLRDPARTCCYAVRTNGADYLYVDWHVAGVDRVPVPADYAGRAFEVVEKSANITVLSQALTSALMVDVSGSASYGYLILKVL